MIYIKYSSASDTIAEEKDAEETKKAILDIVYPVGSFYTTIKSTNPSTILGGTWEERYVIICATTDNNYSLDINNGAMQNSTNIILYGGSGESRDNTKFSPFAANKSEGSTARDKIHYWQRMS